jgi:hypothetical protein
LTSTIGRLHLMRFIARNKDSIQDMSRFLPENRAAATKDNPAPSETTSMED